MYISNWLHEGSTFGSFQGRVLPLKGGGGGKAFKLSIKASSSFISSQISTNCFSAAWEDGRMFLEFKALRDLTFSTVRHIEKYKPVRMASDFWEEGVWDVDFEVILVLCTDGRLERGFCDILVRALAELSVEKNGGVRPFLIRVGYCLFWRFDLCLLHLLRRVTEWKRAYPCYPLWIKLIRISREATLAEVLPIRSTKSLHPSIIWRE